MPVSSWNAARDPTGPWGNGMYRIIHFSQTMIVVEIINFKTLKMLHILMQHLRCLMVYMRRDLGIDAYNTFISICQAVLLIFIDKFLLITYDKLNK